MMCTKKIIVVFLIFLMIFMFGCNSGATKKGVGKGLTIELQTTTPSVVYDSEPIQMDILLRNGGSYTVPANGALLKLSGYDPALFDFPNNGYLRLQRLEGTADIPDGYSNYFTLGGIGIRSGFLNENLPQISSNFIITLCYPYETISSAEVCINPDIYNRNPKPGSCRPGSAKVYNSDSPVSITSVQERYISNDNGNMKVKFDITVSNSGGGKLWSAENDNYEFECGTKIVNNIREIQNKILIKSVSLGDMKLDCQGSGGGQIITLGSSSTFSCLGTINNVVGPYTTQLKINLEYGNSISVSKRVTIKSTQYTN